MVPNDSDVADSSPLLRRTLAMFDTFNHDQAVAYGTDLQGRVGDYIKACRQRIPAFVRESYLWPGAIHLSRAAWGPDVLVAPFNFLMGFPNFLLRLLALFLGFLGARKASKRLLRSHLGLPTRVQKRLTSKLMTDLLDLPADPDDAADPFRRTVAAAAQEPIRIYVQTRNVAADITAGTLAAVTGVLLLHQFTPGSISAGSALSHLFARKQAVSEFALGEALGRFYYSLFPVSPSFTVVAVALLLVMAAIAVVAAFSGMIHDPIQALTGIHRRRLIRLLDAIEESITRPNGKGYSPKDTFFGRAYDLEDWIKGVLSF
jgi:hypothetical protein